MGGPRPGCLGVPFSLKGPAPSLMKSLRVLPALIAALVVVPAAGAQTPRVLAIHFDNDVNPVTADYVVGELERAERDGFDAAVIVVDTPGGLAESMRDIYQKELALKVPVIVYVPTGARAASAGVWIAQAADALGMAPQSNLGSSTPVSGTGGEIPSDLKRKIVNDAAKSLRAIAEEHGRNGDWAEEAVRVGSNLTAREALEMDVIDVVAATLPELLERADGRRTQPKELVVHTAGAQIVNVEMSLWKRILDTVIDPNIIVLLMSIGLLGITVEILNPGLILPGTVGAISLIVGLFGLQVLPVSWAGILLMLLAAAFFGAEAFVTSHGALALAGAVSFVVGALLLFDPAGDQYQVSIWVALAVGGTLAAVTAIAVTKIVQARRAPTKTGQEEVLHDVGVVRSRLAPTGLVSLHGEIWRARTSGEPLEVGEPVRVEAIGEGLVLEGARAEE